MLSGYLSFFLVGASAFTRWGPGATQIDCVHNSPQQCNPYQQGPVPVQPSHPAWSGCVFNNMNESASFTLGHSLDRRASRFGTERCMQGSLSNSAPPSISMPSPNTFSQWSVQVSVASQVTFKYTGADGSTCQHTNWCSPGGTTVVNNNCPNAVQVSFHGQEGCGIGVSSCQHHCAPQSSSVPPSPPQTSSSPPPPPPAISTTATPPPVVSTSSPPPPPAVSTTSTTSAPPPPSTTSSSSSSTLVISSSALAQTTTSVTSSSAPSTTSSLIPSTTVFLTTSTIYTTSFSTVTQCPSTITDCPAESMSVVTMTSVIIVDTTVCPVTATMIPTPSSAAPSSTSSVVVSSSAPSSTSSVVISSSAPSSTSSTDSSAPSTTSVVSTSSSAPTTSSAGAAMPSSSTTSTVPDIVPGCIAAYLPSDCSDNTDSACYCTAPGVPESILQCIVDKEPNCNATSTAVSGFIGICAPYAAQNPSIILSIPANDTCVSVAPPPSGPATTITITGTVTVPCTNSNGPIPSSSTVSSVSTVATVPQVVFTTPSAGPSGTPEPTLVPGPATASAFTTPSSAPSSTSSFVTIASPAPVSEFSDGQPQVTSTVVPAPVSEFSDGQPQVTSTQVAFTTPAGSAPSVTPYTSSMASVGIVSPSSTGVTPPIVTGGADVKKAGAWVAVAAGVFAGFLVL